MTAAITKQPTLNLEPAPSGTPADLLRIAMSRENFPIETLNKLMDMQERWAKNEERKAFNIAFAAFKANPPQINKNKTVHFQSQKGTTHYTHATLDNVCDVIGAALAQHKLSYRWETKQTERRITVTCILSHELGHSESTSLYADPDETGNKNSIQAVGSTVTYLQRYTLLALTGMATADQDTDGRVTPAQALNQMPAERVDEWIDGINSAPNAAVLKDVFLKAMKAAGDDVAAKDKFIACKDRRKDYFNENS